ncbi:MULTISPECIES: cytochrome oxidase putative small subunit CydP [Cupriavidus]|uniref:cytochrome oxidase putative small subunit CydP n=1 Tax=Cupriavidus TaxID=106589 RepID=UPI001428B69A|nr:MULTISPECIES: cytochrome oxidase putative small subunit CydP [Cupriavidus]
MTPNDRRLLRHLLLAVAVKIAVLALLWWCFVADQRVAVDARRAADRLGPPPTAQGAQP